MAILNDKVKHPLLRCIIEDIVEAQNSIDLILGEKNQLIESRMKDVSCTLNDEGTYISDVEAESYCARITHEIITPLSKRIISTLDKLDKSYWI